MSEEDIVIGAGRLRLEDVELEFSRSGGPGGQHVNKTETRVTLRVGRDAILRAFSPVVATRIAAAIAGRLTKGGELILSADRHRERGENVREVWERLGRLLRAAAIPPKPRKKTRPSRGAVERRIADKKRTSDKKRSRRTED